MVFDPTDEFPRYYEFLGEQLRSGVPITPEMALELWRAEHPIDEDEEIIAMVQEALDDIAAGDKGIPLEQVLADFRERYGFGDHER